MIDYKKKTSNIWKAVKLELLVVTTLSTRWRYAQAELVNSQFANWGRRVAHTMHCTADKGCVSLIFTINSQFSGNLWKGSSGAVRFLSSYIFTLDLLRITNRWAETSASGPTNPKHWITQRRLHEGAAQPNGGLADTLVYGNRHRGFNIWALIFFSLWWGWNETTAVRKEARCRCFSDDWLPKKASYSSCFL